MTKASPSQPVVIITGASSGIGLATAGLLADRGYALTLSARTPGPLEEAASLLARGGASPPLTVAADVSDTGGVDAIVDRTLECFGRIDVLINNAGHAQVVPIGEADAAHLQRMFATNAFGPAYAVHRVWPQFTRQRSGCVVNVSTYGTADPFPGFFGYAASKASLDCMVKSIAKEGKSIGVRAFSVAPGAVETPMLRSSFSTEMVPVDMCLTPRQIAEMIIACIEGARDGDNGRTIYLRREGDGMDVRVV